MKTLGKWNYFTQTVQIKIYMKMTKIIYTWHVHNTEMFRYPINDVILKCWKELVKTVLVTVSGKVLFKNLIKSKAGTILLTLISCSFYLLWAHEKFGRRRTVPLRHATYLPLSFSGSVMAIILLQNYRNEPVYTIRSRFQIDSRAADMLRCRKTWASRRACCNVVSLLRQ